MGFGYEEFWLTLPERAFHPHRVPILEAFRWVAEPLSAIGLVDLLDGHITMWEAMHHLRALAELEVVKPEPVGEDWSSRNIFYDLYRLVGR